MELTIGQWITYRHGRGGHESLGKVEGWDDDRVLLRRLFNASLIWVDRSALVPDGEPVRT